ncbi:hypothetical protein TNCV_1500691 [Trichonephila clavipes]|nr:hypothetical protein TNCV_1500691 [Trichonephila clavipes]
MIMDFCYHDPVMTVVDRFVTGFAPRMSRLLSREISSVNDFTSVDSTENPPFHSLNALDVSEGHSSWSRGCRVDQMPMPMVSIDTNILTEVGQVVLRVKNVASFLNFNYL